MYAVGVVGLPQLPPRPLKVNTLSPEEQVDLARQLGDIVRDSVKADIKGNRLDASKNFDENFDRKTYMEAREKILLAFIG